MPSITTSLKTEQVNTDRHGANISKIILNAWKL